MLTDIQKRLFELRDEKYRDFQSPLIPNIKKELFIGVRTPILKGLAKELHGSDAKKEFLSTLPHKYFDENQLHSFLISLEKDFSVCIERVNGFLPYIDNWATCDQLSPKCFYKNPEKLLPYINTWLESGHTYTVRFAILCLMRYFLDERFDIEYASKVALTKCDDYYIITAVAWYFATALAKQYDDILPFISERRIEESARLKAIQKAVESYRISDERKAVLRSFKQN